MKWIDWLWPAQCLCCSVESEYLLCDNCMGEVMWASPEGRCRYCTATDHKEKECLNLLGVQRVAQMFKPSKQVISIGSTIKVRIALSETVSALMLLYMEEFDWPEFDLISIETNYWNSTEKNIAKGLDIPVLERGPFKLWMNRETLSDKKILLVGSRMSQFFENMDLIHHLLSYSPKSIHLLSLV